DSFSFNPRTPTNQSKSRLWQALLTDEWQATKTTALTFGGQFINKTISSNDRGNHSVNNAALFVVVNQQIGTTFFIAPALRLEYNEISKLEAVPQVNLSYRSTKLQLRGSAGKTVRDADFTERYNNYNKTIVASGQRLGNPDLETERSFSYEGGADYFVANYLKISGTYFQRYHKKLIDYVITPYSSVPRKINLVATGVYALAKNIAEVTTKGFEADVQFSKQLSKGRTLWASLGMVWLNSKSSDTLPSFYLSSHAKFLTNFSIQYTHKRLAVSINGLYKKRGSQAVASPLIAKVSTDYIVLNAKADLTVWKDFSAFVEADNIGDRTFTDLLGAQMPGRWLTGGIKISLSK
ncbi:MAG TPA: TonB-dependent receptor, partial [Flavisolibacter sp.]|nr:TonB-dependent receptor [Flavisolibacter sp.]